MLNAMAKSLGGYTPEQLILKITLAGSEPAIWRRVEIHSGLTLHDLHFVLQSVFDLAKANRRLKAVFKPVLKRPRKQKKKTAE